MREMSAVEKYWKKIAAHAEVEVEWDELTPERQHQVIFSINLLLQVLNKPLDK